MSAAVHQLLPVLSYGDAIGAATLKTQTMLHSLGYRGDVFADVIDERLAHRARPARELPPTVGHGDAVLYRLSIGSPLAAMLERLPVRRVVVYHNITPPRYYAGTNERVTYWLERGRGDLRRLAAVAEGVIADSTYNLDEALAAGARRGVVVPPPVDLQRLRPRPARPVSPPEILFVGRVAPNKRVDILITALAALRATDLPDACLVVAGTSHDTDIHVARLRDLARRLGVDGAVDLGGERLTDVELGDRYARAAVFATASEHEGFCVPIVEAMSFGLPVVAFAAGAVPETAGDAALVLDARDPLLWAATLALAVRDDPLRRALAARAAARIDTFADDRVRDRLGAALAAMGISPT